MKASDMPGRQFKGIFPILFVALGLVLAIIFFRVAAKAEPASEAHREVSLETPVAVAKAVRGDLSRGLTFTAEFRPFQQVDVHAKVSGYVREMNVDVGDLVKQGQVIATLEIPELGDELEQAAAGIKVAEANVQKLEADHEDAHLAYTRLAEVTKAQPNLVAQQDVDTARTRDASTQAALVSAAQQVKAATAEQNKIKTMLDYAKITAPFDGVVTRRLADTGALVQAGTASNTQALPLVSLAENQRLRLVIPVQESIVPRIKLGDRVDIFVNALQQHIPGTVSRFARKIDRATRTMETEVDVPNSDLKLTPGMYASVNLTLDDKKNVLTIPVQALSSADKSTVVVVNKNNELEERKVTVGIETPDTVEILDGLKEGELVLIGNRGMVRPGEKVIAKISDSTNLQ